LSDDHWLQGWKNSYTTQGDEEARRQTDWGSKTQTDE
jgi:hypothetical protein